MTVALGYLAAGLVFSLFALCFYDWVPGLKWFAKLRGVLLMVLFWPLVLFVFMLEGL